MKRNLCLGLQFVIELPKVNNIRTEDLNPEQLEKLLMVLDEEKDIHAAAMIRLALFTNFSFIIFSGMGRFSTSSYFT